MLPSPVHFFTLLSSHLASVSIQMLVVITTTNGKCFVMTKRDQRGLEGITILCREGDPFHWPNAFKTTCIK